MHQRCARYHCPNLTPRIALDFISSSSASLLIAKLYLVLIHRMRRHQGATARSEPVQCGFIDAVLSKLVVQTVEGFAEIQVQSVDFIAGFHRLKQL